MKRIVHTIQTTFLLLLLFHQQPAVSMKNNKEHQKTNKNNKNTNNLDDAAENIHTQTLRTGTSNSSPNLASLASNAKHRIWRLNFAQRYEAKTVGLGEVAKGELHTYHGSIEEHEAKVRKQSTSCWLVRFFTTQISAILVFVVYLITLETLMSSALCIGLTIYWYNLVSFFMVDAGRVF